MNKDLNTTTLGVKPKGHDGKINEMPIEIEFYKIKEKILLSYFNSLKEKG
ncbi:MAG: hypothetical protein ACFE9I_13105 [Candidatus Hermodarchaeota archaeon]